jgi:hypothetical protein
LTPAEPSEPPFTFVWFAVEIIYVHAPVTSLQLQWSVSDLEQPGRLEIVGWNDPTLTESDLRYLVKGVEFMRTFYRQSRAGRPSGRPLRDRAWYLNNFRRLAKERGKRPTQQEFLNRYQIDRSLLKANLKTHNLWPWDRFVNVALGAKTHRR